MARPLLGILVLTVAMVGCEDPEATGEYGQPADAAEPRFTWAVGAEPGFSVGGEGDLPLFEVTDVLRLPDGRVIVADDGPRILVFAPDGQLERRMGGEGEGPGEFQAIEWMRRTAGDSMVVYDDRLRRLSHLSPRGEAGRLVTPEAAPGSRTVPRLVGRFADGTLLAAEQLPPESVPRSSTFIIRPELRLMRYDGEGSFEADLGRVPGAELFYMDGVRLPEVPFLRSTFFAVGTDAYYIARGERFGVNAYDRNGLELRRLSKPHEPAPIRAPDLEGLPIPDDVDVAHPPAFPAISAILLDATGAVWVRPFLREAVESVAWTVFPPEGGPHGRVRLPAAFQPMEIGEDYLLGVSRDSVGVETVELYTLVRDGR